MNSPGDTPGIPYRMFNNLPQDAKAWVTCALDPYHDYALNVQGMPDDSPMNSFVRVHNQTAVVGATADDDSISVTFNGEHGMSTIAVSPTVDGAVNLSLATFDVAPFQILRAASGNNPNLQELYAATATSLAKFGTVLNTAIPSRLIAIGFEIHDITQPLYRKGSITAARVQGSCGERTIVCFDSAGQTASVQAAVLPALPATVAQMVSLSGALSTTISDGAYIVPRFCAPACPVIFTEGASSVSHHVMVSEATTTTGRSNYLSVNTADDATWQGKANSAVHSGFEPVRVFLSGLAAESTFRVTLRTIVEYFPDVSTPSEAGIATLSPTYCPSAFEAYHIAAISLPVMVPVSFNAKGDWWRMILKALGTAGSIGLTLAGYPNAARVASLATDQLGRLLPKRQKPKKQQKGGPKRG